MKTIVSLGLSQSGKTNYIAAAIAYMAGCRDRKDSPRRLKDWSLIQKNVDISKIIDIYETDFMRKGVWYRKTARGTKNEFKFDIPLRWSVWPPLLDFSKSVTMADWAGETFAAFTEEQPDACDRLDEFKADLVNASGFILCLDAETLLDDHARWHVQESLRKLCQAVGWLLEDDAPKDADVASRTSRSIAVVITKSDYLVGNDRFCESDSEHLSLSKLDDVVRKSYRSFFNVVQGQKCDVRIFPVSLVPSREWREMRNGSMCPKKEKWELDRVMESTIADEDSIRSRGAEYYGNMYGAFLWLLDNV